MLRLKFPTNEIAQLYLSGLSENAIAKRFQTNRGVILRRLRDAGVQRRDQSEAERLKWSQMNPETRAHQVEAAHKAVCGMPLPHDKLRKVNPTESETYFISLINKHNWPLIYCGQGGLVINGHNPDFIHKTQKKVVEIYTGNKHSERARKYTRDGFQCLFVSMRRNSEKCKVRKVERFLAS